MAFESSNYIGQTTNSTATQWNAAPFAINDLSTSGAGTEEVAITAGDKYMIDIMGDMKSWRPEDTPFLTIIANAPSTGVSAPYYYWIDDYEGNMWVDAAFDDLRTQSSFTTGTYDAGGYTQFGTASVVVTSPTKPTGITDSGQLGGKLAWDGITTWPTDDADISWAGSEEVQPTSGSDPVIMFGMPTATTSKIGSSMLVCQKLHQLLSVYGYTETDLQGDSGADGEYFEMTHNTSVKAPIYMAFENISYTVDDGVTDSEDFEILALIKAFVFKSDYTELGFQIDLGESNLDADWDTDTATKNDVYITEHNTTAFTRIARTVLIGKVYSAPNGIAEGTRLDSVGGFNFHKERKGSLTQIFACPKYGITGTAQASSFRFGDGFQETRARWLTWYKSQKEAAYLFGIKSETSASSTSDAFVDGKPVRTTSGLFDYAMYPMKYFKTTMPSILTTADSGVTFMNWINNIVYKVAAFRQKGSRNFTFLVSQDFINHIVQTNAFIGSHTAGNITGGIWTQSPPSAVNFGLPIYSYQSPYGSVNFVHEPALDITPSIPLPQFLLNQTTGTNVNPRKLMISIDTANIREMTLRPDKIMGNLQEADRDAFTEGIRGEHGLQCRFSRNNAVVYWA